MAAAISAKKAGANVILVEAGPSVGGELVSGLPIDGCLNAQGEWIVGGIAKEFFDGCEALDGYIGALFDWRLMYGVCVDPEVFKLVIIEALARYNVPLLLYTFCHTVHTEAGKVTGIEVINKNGTTLITGEVFVDCSGDADVAIKAGADYERGSPKGEFQPVTLVFRMSGVDSEAYLRFVRDNPDQFVLGESPVVDKSAAECALELYRQGYPFAGISAKGSLLKGAIEAGDMFETMAVYIWPTSMSRREVGFNTTRVANLDATDTDALSNILSTLGHQVRQAITFVKGNVPGFEDANLSGVAPRIGIRETTRIVGEYSLTRQDVVEGVKSDQGIAKGGHHVDIHAAGTGQVREPVKGGKSYDVPYGCLIPKGLTNVLVAGRPISSSREANGSVRVMGQCMATGEAAGLAAAMCSADELGDVRLVPIRALRSALEAQGAILEGTQ